jgi:hypothetical protein
VRRLYLLNELTKLKRGAQAEQEKMGQLTTMVVIRISRKERQKGVAVAA